MISEAKIMLGTHRDEYVVLPVTVLCSLTQMRFTFGKVERKLTWTRPINGAQWLLVDGEPAIEPTDGKYLQRDTDRYGLRTLTHCEMMVRVKGPKVSKK